MSVTGPWTDRHAALAREHEVADIDLDTISFGDQQTADFLLELPWLSSVSISIYAAKDLTAVGQLSQLESLRIYFRLWRLGDQLKPVDFSALSKLRFADVMMCRAFESVLACSAIQELAISNDYDGRLRDLDLSRLQALRDLKLDHIPKLRRVLFHPKARIRALELSLCGSYQVDWERIGPDLRFLLLGGRLNFPLENILSATKLEELHSLEIAKLPPLGFLRQLRHLRTVFLFAASGPKLSDEDCAAVLEINARGKRGRTR